MPKTKGTEGLETPEKATPFSAFEFWCQKCKNNVFWAKFFCIAVKEICCTQTYPTQYIYEPTFASLGSGSSRLCATLTCHERIFVYVMSRRGVIILARRGRSAKLLLLITGVALRPPNWICLRLDLPNYISAAKSWSWYITWMRVMMLVQFLAIRRVWGQWVSYQQPHGDTSPDADNTYSLSLQLGLSQGKSLLFAKIFNPTKCMAKWFKGWPPWINNSIQTFRLTHSVSLSRLLLTLITEINFQSWTLNIARYIW